MKDYFKIFKFCKRLIRHGHDLLKMVSQTDLEEFCGQSSDAVYAVWKRNSSEVSPRDMKVWVRSLDGVPALDPPSHAEIRQGDSTRPSLEVSKAGFAGNPEKLGEFR